MCIRDNRQAILYNEVWTLCNIYIHEDYENSSLVVHLQTLNLASGNDDVAIHGLSIISIHEAGYIEPIGDPTITEID